MQNTRENRLPEWNTRTIHRDASSVSHKQTMCWRNHILRLKPFLGSHILPFDTELRKTSLQNKYRCAKHSLPTVARQTQLQGVHLINHVKKPLHITQRKVPHFASKNVDTTFLSKNIGFWIIQTNMMHSLCLTTIQNWLYYLIGGPTPRHVRCKNTSHYPPPSVAIKVILHKTLPDYSEYNTRAPKLNCCKHVNKSPPQKK